MPPFSASLTSSVASPEAIRNDGIPISQLLGSAFDGIVAAPDPLVSWFERVVPSVRVAAADEPLTVRLQRLRGYVASTFGAQSRQVVDCSVVLAEAFIRSGQLKNAVALLQASFGPHDVGAKRDDGVGSITAPQHAAARAYVCLGDVWLLLPQCRSARGGDEGYDPTLTLLCDRRASWRAAERWYARALTVLCAHAPDAAGRAISAELASAAAGAPFSTSRDFKRRIEAFAMRQGGGLAVHLAPFTLVVLDRLLGVMQAQGRTHHAFPLLRVRGCLCSLS
jgi:hypothetical protein